MAEGNESIQERLSSEYSAGFVTDIESESLPPGLDEDIVRRISAKKDEPQWMTDWRLEAYRRWRTMRPPRWAHVEFTPIDFQASLLFFGPQGGTGPSRLKRSTQRFSAPTKSSAYPCMSRKRWRASRHTEDRGGRGIRQRLRCHDVQGDPCAKPAWCSAPSRTRCANIPNSCGNISAASCPGPTTSTLRSTPPSSAMARSCTCRKTRAVPWNCPPTSASTPRTRDSSNAR